MALKTIKKTIDFIFQPIDMHIAVALGWGSKPEYKMGKKLPYIMLPAAILAGAIMSAPYTARTAINFSEGIKDYFSQPNPAHASTASPSKNSLLVLEYSSDSPAQEAEHFRNALSSLASLDDGIDTIISQIENDTQPFVGKQVYASLEHNGGYDSDILVIGGRIYPGKVLRDKNSGQLYFLQNPNNPSDSSLTPASISLAELLQREF